MKTITIIIQDVDVDGEHFSYRLKEEISSGIKDSHLYSLYLKCEKEIEKLLWQKELANQRVATIPQKKT